MNDAVTSVENSAQRKARGPRNKKPRNYENRNYENRNYDRKPNRTADTETK